MRLRSNTSYDSHHPSYEDILKTDMVWKVIRELVGVTIKETVLQLLSGGLDVR